MTFKKGDEVVVCFPDHGTDGVIEAIYDESHEARVFIPWTGTTQRVALKMLIERPIPQYRTLEQIQKL